MKLSHVLLAGLIIFQLFIINDLSGQQFDHIYSTLPGPGNRAALQWIDFDNDDDLDLFAMGRIHSSLAATRIYINENHAFDEAKRIELGWIEYGSADWADFDNDGDPDLLACGQTGNTMPGTFIFKNNKGTFKKIETNFIKVSRSSCKWFDYDSDKDYDILIMGESSFNQPEIRIYQNNGNETFAEVNTELPALFNGSISTGDIDNDGDMDIYLNGMRGYKNYISSIYKNNDGKFEQIIQFPETLVMSSSAFADYNGDGNIDLMVSGLIDESFGTTTCKSIIYKNDGDYKFTDINSDLKDTYESSVTWGDVDNDGDPDVLITGRDEEHGGTCSLYRNDGNDQFTLTDDRFFGLFEGDACFGDYDNDGDLDLITSGSTNGSTSPIELYMNKETKRKTTYEAITSAAASVNNYSVEFSWESSVLSNTPASGQSFSIRIGTATGKNDVISPAADTSGLRKIAEYGNIPSGSKWTLNDFEGGDHYWSIQAVDHSLNGSEFFKEQKFSVKPRPPLLQIPADSSHGLFTSLELVWKKSRGAKRFRVQVSTDSSFNSLIFSTPFKSDTTFSPEGLNSATRYYWRAAAEGDAGVSDWSRPFMFTTYIRVPEIISPVDSSFYYKDSVKFLWHSVPEADSYDIQYSSPWSWFNPTENVKDTFYYFSPGSTSFYTWRVCSVNEIGKSDWSEWGALNFQHAAFTRHGKIEANSTILDYRDDGKIDRIVLKEPVRTLTSSNDILVGLELPLKDYDYNGIIDTIHSVITHDGDRNGQHNEINEQTRNFRGFGTAPGYCNLNYWHPALNSLPQSWPYRWPDHIEWGSGKWNSLFGQDFRDIQTETYFKIDDQSDNEFNSLFHPVNGDTVIQGHGINVGVRYLMFDRPELKNIIYKIYDIINVGTTEYKKVFFGKITGIHLGISIYNMDNLDDQCKYDSMGNIFYSFDTEENKGVDWFGEAPILSPYTKPGSYYIFEFDKCPDMSDDELLWETFKPGKFHSENNKQKNYDYMYGSRYFSLSPLDSIRMVIILAWGKDSTTMYNNIRSAKEAWNNNFGFEGFIPVKLISFSGKYLQDKIELTWVTEPEERDYGFDVERNCGNGWEKIGYVNEARVDSNKEYHFTDLSKIDASFVSYRLKQMHTNGVYSYSDEINIELAPHQYYLSQNYPNPFNPLTNINYSIPVDGRVTLKIYDTLGKEVATLINENKTAGNYTIQFSAGGLASGVYFYRIESGNFSAVKKLMLVK